MITCLKTICPVRGAQAKNAKENTKPGVIRGRKANESVLLSACTADGRVASGKFKINF